MASIDNSSVKSGFWNAVKVNGVPDRTYTNEDMQEPYTELISDGVFVKQKVVNGSNQSLNDSSSLKVIAATGMNVKIKAGKGLFVGRWFHLLTDQTQTVTGNTSSYDRIDSIIIRIDSSSRESSLVYRQGTAAENPVPPTINRNAQVTEYRLANITVRPSMAVINNADITDMRGREGDGGAPFCSGLIKDLSTQQLFTKWDDMFARYFQDVQAQVAEWGASVASQTPTVALSPVYWTTTIGADGTDELDIPMTTAAGIPTAVETYHYYTIILCVNGFVLRQRQLSTDPASSYDYYIKTRTDMAMRVHFKTSLDKNSVVSAIIFRSIAAADVPTLEDDITALRAQVTNAVVDSGWNLVDTAEGVDASGTHGVPLKIRKIGNIVSLRGTIKLSGQNPIEGTLIGTLPTDQGYLPDGHHRWASQSFGGTQVIIEVNSLNGQISFVAPTTSNANGAEFPIDTTWFAGGGGVITNG